jgi:hypothetical protein
MVECDFSPRRGTVALRAIAAVAMMMHIIAGMAADAGRRRM